MSSEEQFHATNLVRRYTFELEDQMTSELPSGPSGDLVLALVEKRRNEEQRERLRSYWESSDTSDLEGLERQRDELHKAWFQFHETLPAEQRIALGLRPMKREDIVKLVDGVRKDWETRRDSNSFGQAKKYFHRFSRTLDGHSNLSQLLPTSSQYVSIFYGSLHTVIQASMKYQKVCESLARALSEINDAVSTIDKKAWLYRTTAIEVLVARLYTQVFQFLVEVMKWYTKKSRSRLLQSFNQSLYEDLAYMVVEIKRVADLISQEAQGGLAAEVRSVRLDINEMNKLCLASEGERKREIQEVLEKMQQDMKRVIEAEHRKQLDENKALMLQSLAMWMENLQKNPGIVMKNELLGTPATQMLEDVATAHLTRSLVESSKKDKYPVPIQNAEPPITTREEVQALSAHLEAKFSRAQILCELNSNSALFVEERVHFALQNWMAGCESRTLHISWSGQSMPGISSALAARLVPLLHESGVPVVSYFCELSNQAPGGGQTREESETVALVYAIIRQLTDLLPVYLEGPPIAHTQLHSLDGSLNSLDIALLLLDNMLHLIKEPLFFCIIDGLQWLDATRTASHLRRLINILKNHVERITRQPDTFKVLFTVSGRSEAILEVLDEGDMVRVSQGPGARALGRPSPGRKTIRSLNFVSQDD